MKEDGDTEVCCKKCFDSNSKSLSRLIVFKYEFQQAFWKILSSPAVVQCLFTISNLVISPKIKNKT